jgi:hypothetical protein
LENQKFEQAIKKKQVEAFEREKNLKKLFKRREKRRLKIKKYKKTNMNLFDKFSIWLLRRDF